MSPFLPLAAACALFYLPLTARPASKMRSITKTLAVALLALGAIYAQAPPLLIVALAFCALGDGLLSRESEGGFMAGVGAFAAGHLAYIALFLTHPLADFARLGQAPQLWIVAGFSLTGVAMVALLGPRAGDMRLPVLGYIPIILGMGVAGLVLPNQGLLVWILPSALAFVASDIVLSVEKFVLAKDHVARRVTPYIIWPLYWGAQAGFFTGFSAVFT